MEMSSKTRRRRLGRVVFRLIAIIPIGLGLPACTSGGHASVRAAGAPSPASVYASDAMLAWEAAAPPDFTRFEFGRNDTILGSQPAVALRATDQWPQPLAPIERPVQFELFQQDRVRTGRYSGRYTSDRYHRGGGYRSYRGSRDSRYDNSRNSRGSYNGRSPR